VVEKDDVGHGNLQSARICGPYVAAVSARSSSWESVRALIALVPTGCTEVHHRRLIGGLIAAG
jgi:hypothetical protein